MADRKIRFGVLGAAKIALEKVIPAMQRCARAEVVAIASREHSKARAAADRLGLTKAYGTYDELLADPEIDAVYNPLPNDLHVPWSERALAAGKHVLCEKPIGLSVAEAERLAAAGRRAPRQKLMEAFMYRHHPQWQLARRLALEGGIGQLRTIQGFFSYYNDDPLNIRNVPAQGGGGLMDIGCYPISWSRWLFQEEPRRVLGLVELDPRFQVDRLASGILEFSAGHATFTCSTQLMPYQRVNLCGTQGRVEIEIPCNAPWDKPCRVWHYTPDGSLFGHCEEHVLPPANQYTIQGDLFAAAILDDRPVPTSIDDALGNMRVIEALRRSGQTSAWEKP